MARLSKENTAYERDEDGNLPEKEVPLKTLSDEKKSKFGAKEDEEATVKLRPPTRGKLDRLRREAEEENEDDEDEVTDQDMALIREHVVDPDYDESDYIPDVDLVTSLIVAIYSEATGIPQEDFGKEMNLDDVIEEAEDENFREQETS